MSKLFVLGDSNVYHNILAERLSSKVGMPVTLLNTTCLHTLELGLKEASGSGCDLLLVSCLENIIHDSSIGKAEELLKDCILSTIADYVKLISLGSSVFSKILVMSPILRKDPKWFPDYLSMIREALSIHVEMYPCIHLLPNFHVIDDDLEPGYVHLNTSAGAHYFEHISSCISDVISLDSTEVFHSPLDTVRAVSRVSIDLDHEPSNSDLLAYLKSNIVSCLNDHSGIKDKVTSLEKKTARRAQEDDYVFASLHDDLDQTFNEKRSDCLVVTGLKVPSDFPTSLSDQKKCDTMLD